MNELQVTVVGWAATEVRVNVGRNGATVASFRLASTPRYYDRAREVWVDGATEWFTVRAFRGAAVLMKRSILKGQPVLVTGRMRSSTWEGQDGQRTDLIIEATAVGHDCTRGFATFTRASGNEAMEGDGSAKDEAIAAARVTESDPLGAAPEGPLEDSHDDLDEPELEEAELEEAELARG